MSAVQPKVVDDQQEIRYSAPFTTRFVALLIDSLIAVGSILPGLILLVLSPTQRSACTVSGSASTCSVPAPGWLAFAMTIAVIGAVVNLAWFCRRTSRGQSVGQRAAGVRLVDAATVQPVGPWRVFSRQVAQLVSIVPFGLGYLWTLWDARAQTWHDKIAGTIVVQA